MCEQLEVKCYFFFCSGNPFMYEVETKTGEDYQGMNREMLEYLSNFTISRITMPFISCCYLTKLKQTREFSKVDFSRRVVGNKWAPKSPSVIACF